MVCGLSLLDLVRGGGEVKAPQSSLDDEPVLPLADVVGNQDESEEVYGAR